MPDKIDLLEPLEPERYELREAPTYEFTLSRREFVEVAGAGLLITVTGSVARAQPGAAGRSGGTLESRLHIGEDGTVTILTGKVEVGQGSRTELAMAAAEEMRIAPERVRVVMADTDLVPNDGLTAGSRTTPSTVPAVRAAAATARELLENLRRTAKSAATYTDLARSSELAAAYKQTPGGAAVTPVKDWQVLGRPRYRIDGREIVTGAHQFPSDIQRQGMLYGSVLRAPSYGATLAAVDPGAAAKAADAVAVREGNFVGCVAPTSYASRKGLEAIAATARWETKEHPSSAKLFAHLKETASKPGGASRAPRIQSKGSIEDGLGESKHRLRAEYRVPFIQHAPMEPRAAVAEWADGRLTVWTGTQNPFGVRDQLVQAFHLTPEKVRVIVPDSGGGFGGKHTGETAIEAARLAKEAGRPVSLRWTRAEEFMWAYFRPAGLFEIEAGVDANGLIHAWDFSNYNAGTAAIESPYRSANARTRFLYCDSPLREGSYRGIAATANNFARECFIDELALAASADPLEFRLANLDDTRMRDVLLAASKQFNWRERGAKRTPRVGRGIACGTEKGSYVAACAEVEVDVNSGQPHVRDFVMAFECGAILNPANLRMQVEGSIIQGLGGALTEAIEFENGQLKNGSFAKYRVPRFRDVPPFEVVLVNRPDLPPAGAGETPIIAVAPAIANAAFDATGERSRSMPVRVKA
ncbi:MAG: isoquinoline 1-oxidoreductase [Bryobacterales bacterium]|nr:isoquinoline 1-oxidoreductase [Bryobacterales bacterium]